VTLTSKRLRLEALSVCHVADVVAYRLRNRAYLEPWEPSHASHYFTEEYVATAIERLMSETHATRFALFERDGEHMIGFFDISEIRRGIVQAATIGYSVDEAHTARGYATEGVGVLTAYAFDVLGLHRLEASYFPENEASGRALVKNGFRVEAYARELLFIGNRWRDAILVAKTNHAFRWNNPVAL